MKIGRKEIGMEDIRRKEIGMGDIGMKEIGMKEIEIKEYAEDDREEIIELVLYCQNDGSRPLVGVEDQPELLCIRAAYFTSGGCFWVAKVEGRVVGCIGLMNLGGGLGVLKKFFVREAYRGKPNYLGRRLYGELLRFAREHQFMELILDTPKNTERAHRFYDKAGFVKIDEGELPVQYDHPYEDCDFFRLSLA